MKRWTGFFLVCAVGAAVLFGAGGREKGFAEAETAYDLYVNGSGKNITANDPAYQKKDASDEDGFAPMTLYAQESGQAGMKASDEAIEMIKSFEGCLLSAYKAVETEKYYTIGYGHYGSDVSKDMTITKEEAEALLRQDLENFYTYINVFLNNNNIVLTQNQFDALVSFTYNVGPGWMTRTTTIATYLKSGVGNYTKQQIVDAFAMWNTSGGKVLTGLTVRRYYEAVVFLGGPSGAYTVQTDSLKIRTGAGTGYSAVGELQTGDRISVTAVKRTGMLWGQTKAGWVCLHSGTQIYAMYDSAIAAISKVSNTVNGVRLQWTSDPDAVSYNVMRQSGEEDAVMVANVTDTVYEDADVKSGTNYTYYVNPVDEIGNINVENAMLSKQSITYAEAPEPTLIRNEAKGVSLKWKKVKNIRRYRVYRRSDTVGWKCIAKTEKTSYLDGSAVSGTAYQYKIYSVALDGELSGYYPATAITYYRKPEVTLSNTKSGVKIQWELSEGAPQYLLFRKKDTPEAQWKRLAVTAKKSYLDQTAKNGTKYRYTICVVAEDGKTCLSAVSQTGRAIMRMGETSFRVTKKKGRIYLTWNKVKGAAKYQIMRKKKGDPSWVSLKKISAQKARTYTDSSALWGKTYYYKVFALEGSKQNHAVAKKIKR